MQCLVHLAQGELELLFRERAAGPLVDHLLEVEHVVVQESDPLSRTGFANQVLLCVCGKFQFLRLGIAIPAAFARSRKYSAVSFHCCAISFADASPVSSPNTSFSRSSSSARPWRPVIVSRFARSPSENRDNAVRLVAS